MTLHLPCVPCWPLFIEDSLDDPVGPDRASSAQKVHIQTVTDSPGLGYSQWPEAPHVVVLDLHRPGQAGLDVLVHTVCSTGVLGQSRPPGRG